MSLDTEQSSPGKVLLRDAAMLGEFCTSLSGGKRGH